MCTMSHSCCLPIGFFFFNDTATTEIYTLSLHDALPICAPRRRLHRGRRAAPPRADGQRVGRLRARRAAARTGRRRLTPRFVRVRGPATVGRGYELVCSTTPSRSEEHR